MWFCFFIILLARGWERQLQRLPLGLLHYDSSKMLSENVLSRTTTWYQLCKIRIGEIRNKDHLILWWHCGARWPFLAVPTWGKETRPLYSCIFQSLDTGSSLCLRTVVGGTLREGVSQLAQQLAEWVPCPKARMWSVQHSIHYHMPISAFLKHQPDWDIIYIL